MPVGQAVGQCGRGIRRARLVLGSHRGAPPSKPRGWAHPRTAVLTYPITMLRLVQCLAERAGGRCVYPATFASLGQGGRASRRTQVFCHVGPPGGAVHNDLPCLQGLLWIAPPVLGKYILYGTPGLPNSLGAPATGEPILSSDLSPRLLIYLRQSQNVDNSSPWL